MPTLMHISDSHLGLPGSGERWERALDLIAARRPDLVLHTGDVTERGRPEELECARAGLDRTGVPWRALPGNHDVGDGPPNGTGPCRLASARFDQALGPSRFVERLGAWTLVGFGGLELGTENDAEADLWRWLDDSLASATGRVVLALHKPPFLTAPSDATETSQMVPLSARKRLWRSAASQGVQLILSGHRHAYRVLQRPDVACVWAPALAGPAEETLPFAFAPSPPALVEFRLGASSIQHQLVPLGGDPP